MPLCFEKTRKNQHCTSSTSPSGPARSGAREMDMEIAGIVRRLPGSAPTFVVTWGPVT